MKKLTVIILLIFFPFIVFADDESNYELLYGYLSGTYIVIGKELESERTYTGKIIFESKKDHIIVTRIINGESIQGIGKIEHTRFDKVNVFRVRFKKEGKDFEITYLWMNDLDNYGRLSGHVYQPGKRTFKPGLEALFIDHSNQ
ncbi:MAG: hypothetical protein SV375_22210 [Thermodesulfobacteriota bacterium]|nr:hypothetical protein [Thermodesulfobacteriota bacterium]